jgi:hypothetical protein
VTGNDLTALAADAYIYGFPLVLDLSMVERFTTEGIGTLPPTPFNRFAHSVRLADPDATFVSVNNDTLYSIAQLDLSAGPLLLHVPDTRGAYYVLQFVDAWSNNFAYIGRRATGTKESVWLITPPGWSGTPPDGVQVIAAPTAVATIVGRNAIEGPGDLPRVIALQRQLTLRPMGPPGGADGGALPVPQGAGLPVPDPAVPKSLRFFERLRLWMAAFPPAAADIAHQRAYVPLGLLQTTGTSPYTDPDPTLASALERGMAAGKDRVEAANDPVHGDPDYEESGHPVRPGYHGIDADIPHGVVPVGGWEMDLHLFDYNLDHFGPGTVDSARWRIPDRPAAYLTRAVAARTGLWGNHAYEAVYAHTFTAADGTRLTGRQDYTLRFETPPPVRAFWSITMYDTPDYLLVRNPADRYSVGDRTPGLRYGADGSLTLVLRHDRPADPGERANWLPTPPGGFRPVLRMYEPDRKVLDGGYLPPPITPVRV